ncbi:MAG: deoxyribodipyrimidine photo-lyase, partial [Rhodospirillaceae bacterium]|nr:deoxyribodipyrimidine photo-lyase [Rhodospirillaceae bacterium]
MSAAPTCSANCSTATSSPTPTAAGARCRRRPRSAVSANAPPRAGVTAGYPTGARVLAPVIVWFRQDLRLSDNPALHAAAAAGRPVIPLYILDRESAGAWAPGGASRWWLHHSLEALSRSLASQGLRLVLRRGAAGPVLERLIVETGARGVYWNRLYEPWATRRDDTIRAAMQAAGVAVESFNAALLFEPWEIATKGGAPYRVFTPFWRACLAAEPPASPLPVPAFAGPAAAATAGSEELDSWG